MNVIVTVREMEEYLNDLLKVAYQDGDRLTTMKGNLIKYEKPFLHLRTLSRIVLINENQIVSIKVLGEDKYGN